jgi:hypothetical protein
MTSQIIPTFLCRAKMMQIIKFVEQYCLDSHCLGGDGELELLISQNQYLCRFQFHSCYWFVSDNRIIGESLNQLSIVRQHAMNIIVAWHYL